MISYWENETFIKNIDLLVIGSGIVGLNAAIEYKKQNPKDKVIVIEKGPLPSGASTKNAGFACFGSLTELLDDLSKMSKDDVYQLVEKRWNGLQAMMKLLGKSNIDFQQNGSFELFMNNEESIFENAIDKIETINTDLKELFPSDVFSLKDKAISKFDFKGVSHLIKNNFEGQINTGLMMKNLIDLCKEIGIDIYNGIEIKTILDLQKPTFLSSLGRLQARKCIIATNGFAQQLLPDEDVKPARAQVLITKPINNLKIEGTFHYEQGYYYFRNIHNRVLFGGGRSLDFVGETTTSLTTTDLIQNELEKILKTVILPNTLFEVEYSWAGIMGVGNTKKPIIKNLSDNIVIAVRMGGMGVAIGTLIGQEAAQLLNE